jgi:hypothetical protein
MENSDLLMDSIISVGLFSDFFFVYHISISSNLKAYFSMSLNVWFGVPLTFDGVSESTLQNYNQFYYHNANEVFIISVIKHVTCDNVWNKWLGFGAGNTMHFRCSAIRWHIVRCCTYTHCFLSPFSTTGMCDKLTSLVNGTGAIILIFAICPCRDAKLKLSLYTPARHIGGAEVQNHTFLTVALGVPGWYGARPWGKSCVYQLSRRLGGPKSRSGIFLAYAEIRTPDHLARGLVILVTKITWL